MKRNGTIKRLIALSLALSIFSACGSKIEENVEVNNDSVIFAQTTENSLKSMLDEPVIDYEIQTSYPSICVDLNGYELTDIKQAIIISDNLPSTFQVIDSKTDQVIFEGNVKLQEVTYDDGKESCIADFSSVDVPGSYYIKADYVGVSKQFEIKEGVYKNLLLKAVGDLNSLRYSNSKWTINDTYPMENDQTVFLDVSGGWLFGENGERDSVKGSIAAMDLMLAFEYNGKTFTDDFGIAESGNKIPDILDEITYEMEWLLKMQNPSTGGVYSSVYLPENSEDKNTLYISGETTRATAYFCAAMAKYSIISKKYDSNISAKCFNAASKAYKCLEANKDIVSEEQMYRAAVEMYRATGYSVYLNIINKFLESNKDKEFEGRTTLDAAITYLATERATNAEHCSLLMANFMQRTEDKSTSASKSRYLVEIGPLEVSEYLRNTAELVVVDYIISSIEYLKLEKNYLHYLCGRNETHESLVNFGYSPDNYAQFIILLGRLANE